MALTLDSQLAALNENKIHRYAILWRITRTDGTKLRFTNHNTDITFQGSTYQSAVGFQVSATQRESGLNEQNKEAVGITVPAGIATGINYDDMRAGRYRDATVWEYLVDWQYPWLGATYETKYKIAEMAFDGFTWKAELVGLAKFLRISVGKIYNRNCRHRFGIPHHVKNTEGDVLMFEARCNFNLVSGTVDFTSMGGSSGMAAGVEQTVTGVTAATPRVEFQADIPVGFPDNAFRNGVCIFTSGDNDGLSFDIQSSTQSGAAGGTIKLYTDAPFDIAIGNTVQMTVGCNKTTGACQDLFDNYDNYGGYPNIPGADRAILIPDVKR